MKLKLRTLAKSFASLMMEDYGQSSDQVVARVLKQSQKDEDVN